MTEARPNRRFGAGLPDAVDMRLIDLREIDPPAGQPNVHWRLLTTRPVRDSAQAWAVVDLYRRRWAIEQLFRTLKTQGFDIEGIRIQEPGPRDKLVTAAFIAAVAVQQLVHGRDGGQGPLRPCFAEPWRMGGILVYKRASCEMWIRGNLVGTSLTKPR